MQIIRIGGRATVLQSADVVGAKAAHLSRMTALGLPVPPAFVLPVKFCAAIAAGEADAMRAMKRGLEEGVTFLESAMDRKFGDMRKPLLLSVRSGAALQ